MEVSDKIWDCILAVYTGHATLEEKELLENWLKEAEEHETFFRQIAGTCQYLVQTAYWEKYTQRKHKMWEEVLKLEKRQRRFYRIKRWAYVAVLILLLGSGGMWYYLFRPESLLPASHNTLVQSGPGKSQAILELASGKQIELQSGENREIQLENGATVVQDSLGELKYISGQQEKEQNQLEYHVLRIPAGGEYHIVLEDGTRVWLNSETELRFPVHFGGQSREVQLIGEAYFEVAADVRHPFYIHTSEATVKVVGTFFNVSAYPDEQQVEVALLAGKICFTPENQKEYILTPGEVIRLQKDSQKVSISQEDVASIMAWRTGTFYFENMALEQLFTRLSRWYQVKFVLDSSDVAEMRFTGAVTKYRDLEYILKIIARTKDLSFIKEGEEIRVVRKLK